MSTDTTFITNESSYCLRDRFQVLIKDTRLFDALVGYFYSSGFYTLVKSLDSTEKIRILVGIGTDKEITSAFIQAQDAVQSEFEFSHAESKEQFSNSIVSEMEEAEDSFDIENGIFTFVEWLKSGKIEIKAYPSANIHSKLYIMTFKEDDKDIGRVITGSSNFTKAGLVDNLEFNVELKDKSDYDFALQKFNELWNNSVDLKDCYIETLKVRTRFNEEITPYELFLKLLYEYFKSQINTDQDDYKFQYLPEGFLNLEYQREAVRDAKRKLEQYGGAFLSDVVGLGKTYISAMLARELDGRTLVIAPPALLDRNNPGSWPNVFADFKVPASFESVGKLDKLVKNGVEKYDNVFIDEAHRFRSEMTTMYDDLAKICRGKRVILVTATPLNNSPMDILSQVKLFQNSKRSTIPNLPNLEQFFGKLTSKLIKLDRGEDYDEYIKTVSSNAKEIREKVLKYLIVRRTRSEIVHYFEKDLSKQHLRFPEVTDPEPVFYQLNGKEDAVFNRSIELIKNFNYSRYTPMLHYQGKITQPEELSQKNMRKFMKMLLVKRLESSFHAFRSTLARFIKSYEQFLNEFDKGDIYISKKYSQKLFDLLEIDDEEAIDKLLEQEKVRKYSTSDFKPEYQSLLEKDLAVLKEMDSLWKTVHRDPKLSTFLDILKNTEVLRSNKLIIFTESRETSEYLTDKINEIAIGKALAFSGSSSSSVRETVINNFDARAKNRSDEYRILITTEVLAEGVNLHRSNVVINYDIPWNPTRLMQRVGRINRVDTGFYTIYTYNFFPTKQANEQIKLKEAAEYKIQAFIEMLGADARLLTEGEEVKSHDLFERLSSKKTITGEDGEVESELKYLNIIRDVRDNNPDLFEKIKRLPRKARTGKSYEDETNALITYFRKGKLDKFFQTTSFNNKELDFISAARLFEVEKDIPRKPIDNEFYTLLEKNKAAFIKATEEEQQELPVKMKTGRNSATYLLKIMKSNQIKYCKEYTDEDELYIRKVIQLIENGSLPKHTLKTLKTAVEKNIEPLKILAQLKLNIASEFFKEHLSESAANTKGPREVILSEYLLGTKQ